MPCRIPRRGQDPVDLFEEAPSYATPEEREWGLKKACRAVLCKSMEVLRCPHCGAPAPPYASACAWCGGVLTPKSPHELVTGSSASAVAGPLQAANEFTVRGAIGFLELFQVEDSSGSLLARGHRSLTSWVGLVEIVYIDPAGEFLMALRLRDRPGHPFVQVNIPFLAVNDQGRRLGELLGKFNGWKGRSYTLWSNGEELLSVPSTSRSKPYPILERGQMVAEISENFGEIGGSFRQRTTWTVRFTAGCDHLRALALVTHVALHRGAPGVSAG